MSFLRLALVLATSTACAAGCGPEITPPGAKGQISILPGQEPTGFTRVEVRLMEDDDGGSLDLAELIKEGDDAEARMPLEALPMDYAIEHESDTSEVKRWRVVVWLSTTESADAPADGDLIGTELFDLEDCTAPFGEDAFCGTTDGVDVLIDAVVQIQ